MSKGENRDASDQGATEQDGPITVEVGEHEYTIDRDALDDFELLDDLGALSSTGDAGVTPSILRRLLGPEQTRVAIDRLRDEKTGRVTVEAGSTFAIALLNSLESTDAEDTSPGA